PVVGCKIGASRTDVIEQNNAIPILERRRHEPPHVLIAAKTVGEQHRLPFGPAGGDDVVPSNHIHSAKSNADVSGLLGRRAHASCPCPFPSRAERTASSNELRGVCTSCQTRSSRARVGVFRPSMSGLAIPAWTGVTR